MNIVIASGESYSKLAITTIKSLLMTNTDVDEIVIYYISDNVSDNSKIDLSALVSEYGRKIVHIDMPEYLYGFSGSHRNGQIVFSYCFLQDILPEYVDKVLLLEADQIVTGSLAELYNTDLKGCYIAAADDLQSSVYKKKIGMKKDSPYVNCGVILYNLKKWRDDNISKTIMKHLKSQRHMFFYDVQDVINYTVEGAVKVLPPKYNCTTSVFLFSYKNMIRYRRPSTKCSEHDYSEGKKHPVIVHFTKNQIVQPRPWIEDCYHPYRKRYLRIRSKTIMKDEPLEEYKQGFLNKLARIMYLKVSKTLTASVLGVVHAYLYPAFLYKFMFKYK